MLSTITAVAAIAALLGWHQRTRRHPGWRSCDAGRFAVYCGYSLVAIAAYWLVEAPTATTWEWTVGNAWALAAMVSFVGGFDALNRVAAQQAEVARAIETLPSSPDLASATE